MRLTRLTGIVAGLFLTVLIVSAAWGTDIEWGLEGTKDNLNWGFRGIAWGTGKSDVKDKQPLDNCVEMNSMEENCNAPEANLSVKDVPLIHLRYQFLDDKFYGISMKFAPKFQKRMRLIMSELLGPPTGLRDNYIPLWDLPDINVWVSDTHLSVKWKKILGEVKEHKDGGF